MWAWLWVACGAGEPTCQAADALTGTATASCAYAYTFDSGVDEGSWSSLDVTCEQYASAGDQLLNVEACEQAGRDAGATTATCTCTPWTLAGGCDPCETAD